MIVILAKSKLNSMKSTIYALIDNETNHEDFKIIINEERNYRKLKALE